MSEVLPQATFNLSSVRMARHAAVQVHLYVVERASEEGCKFDEIYSAAADQVLPFPPLFRNRVRGGGKRKQCSMRMRWQ